MKTSFYFVLWIIISVVLLQLNSVFIARYSFVIATGIVLILSWIINSQLSYQTYLHYETKLHRAQHLEKYMNRNSDDNNRSLNARLVIKFIVSAGFIISAILLTWALYSAHEFDWWLYTHWFALAVYIIFIYRIVTKQITNTGLKTDDKEPTEYKDYVIRKTPKHFNAFLRLNLGFSIIAIMLGLLFIVCSIYLFATHNDNRAIGVACVCYIYGSLAAYFGVKDFISTFTTIMYMTTSTYRHHTLDLRKAN